MKRLLILPLVLFGASQVMAEPSCTDAKRDTWIPAAQVKHKLQSEGYRIKSFKATDGGCYEVYAHDKANNRVELYVHPVTGKVFQDGDND